MRLIFIIALCAFSFFSYSQDTANTTYKKRLNLIRYGGLVTYAISMVGLNELWYKNSARESFHFFNDAAEWKQVDKAGHAFSSFQISQMLYHSFNWAGVSSKKSALSATLISFGLLTSIEVFDGFSSDYGASATDIVANAGGSLLFWSQMSAWKKIIVYPKFSFNYTSLARQNPDLLGSNRLEQILKDYNGQTYWLSFDMNKITPLPRWLNIAIGYGASGMIYARDAQNSDPYRQFYLGLDFDLTAVKSKSKIVNGLIYFVNMVKIPAPAIEFSKRGSRFHFLYF